MPIDVITKYFYPVAAGIEMNILETYSVLAQKGWQVTIHTSNNTYLESNNLPASDTTKGLPIRRYSFISELFGFWPDIVWRGSRVICLHNFNVFFWRYFVKALWLKLTGRKKFALVVTPHGGFTPEWSIFPQPIRLAKQIYHLTFGVFFLNFVADSIRAVSEWERAEIIRYGVSPAKITVISNGLEDEAFQDIDKLASPLIKQQVRKLDRYLIQVGRIYQIKNYETAIRALPLTPPDVKFVIVGPPEKNIDYQNSLVKLAHELGVGERVIFLGVVRGIDKYYLIKHAQAMIHMAIWESFCNVVHEALSQKVPCLVANNTALPYLIKNGVNGFLIDTLDHQALADKINVVLTQKTKFEFTSFPTWTQTADKMHRLYGSLVKSND